MITVDTCLNEKTSISEYLDEKSTVVKSPAKCNNHKLSEWEHGLIPFVFTTLQTAHSSIDLVSDFAA